MFKVNNRNTRAKCEICSKLAIKIPEGRQWRRSGIFIVNFEHISFCSSVSILNFEQINAYWVIIIFDVVFGKFIHDAERYSSCKLGTIF